MTVLGITRLKSMELKRNSVKPYILLLIVLVSAIIQSQAQIVYIADKEAEATKKAFVVDKAEDADVIVYKTHFKSDAKKDSGVWYLSEWKSEADMRVYFTKEKSKADFTVFYSKDISEAGWRGKIK